MLAPWPYFTIPGASVVVNASDSGGNPVTRLNVPVDVSLTFGSSPGLNTNLAQIYTIDLTGAPQSLVTKIVSNVDGSYTADAQTTHFSPFVVYAPATWALVPQLYVPVAFNNPAGG